MALWVTRARVLQEAAPAESAATVLTVSWTHFHVVEQRHHAVSHRSHNGKHRVVRARGTNITNGVYAGMAKVSKKNNASHWQFAS